MRKKKPRRTRRNKGRHWEIKLNPFFVGGKTGVFYVFLVGAHQPKFAQERKEKKTTCHMLQTRVIKKPYVGTPLLTKNWWFTTCIVVKEEQWFFNVKPGKIKKRKRGLEAKIQETPKNEQGKMKNIFNWIYGCFYVIKRKHTPPPPPKKKKERDKNSKTNEDRKPEKKKKNKGLMRKKKLVIQ